MWVILGESYSKKAVMKTVTSQMMIEEQKGGSWEKLQILTVKMKMKIKKEAEVEVKKVRSNFPF
jgi:hypothetical protein